MSSRYLLTPQAEADVDEIIQYLAERSDDAPLTVYSAFLDAFERLSGQPHIGHVREDLTDRGLKFLSVYSYLIVYNHQALPLQIVAVLHGARDVASLIRER